MDVPVTNRLTPTPLMMLPPIGLRDRRIEECPTMWFNVDLFGPASPDWKVDVDKGTPMTYYSLNNPGETIEGYPVRITLKVPGTLWMSTDRFCRMGGLFGEVLIEARWPD